LSTLNPYTLAPAPIASPERSHLIERGKLAINYGKLSRQWRSISKAFAALTFYIVIIQ